jgi:predicted peptidase
VPASKKAVESINKSGWNSYVIRAIGNKIVLTLNGVKSAEFTEDDPKVARTGSFGLQIHAGGPMTIEFKDLWIQPLPSPTADNANEPGFHLKTIKTDAGEWKYTVYVPKGYDGQKAFPVVLFLHGSGERGEDGALSAQVGLGPAILAHPESFPAIAVFPQARKTWKADSDDARAALAVLDDVLANYKTDRDRVVVTGLSMGGSGTWDIATAHPDRFAALAPICGQGRTEMTKTLKSLPTWVVCGDADSKKTVLNGRSMTESLRAEGGSPRLTEYRGVGHNSWDRAYNDPAFISWLLAQKK